MRKQFKQCYSRLWIATAMLLSLASCNLFEYHPYDFDYLDETNINEKAIARIQANESEGDTLVFAFMGDTQRFYDETTDFVNEINQRDDIDFVIHAGDITDFGTSREYDWIHDRMRKLDVPYFALIGNHDILGHGKEVFQEAYGDFDFSFITKHIRFICLNTNALEFDYSTPVPNFDYMYQFLNDSSDYNQTIVVMHSPPFSEQFNNNSAQLFNYILEQYGDVSFCIHGHNHRLEVNDFFDNGMIYYGCDDMEGRNYLVFRVTPDSYTYTVEYF